MMEDAFVIDEAAYGAGRGLCAEGGALRDLIDEINSIIGATSDSDAAGARAFSFALGYGDSLLDLLRSAA